VRDPQARLEDVLEAIGNIERYASRGRDAFERDELIQSWCVRHLQIIGEAARGLPQEVKDKATGIPWARIVGMRHILVRDYFGIDTNAVWDAVESDLPSLKRRVETLLRSLRSS